MKIVKVLYWVMLEGVRNRFFWVGMMIYMVFLIIFLWFLGKIFGDDYLFGYMFFYGWIVRFFKVDFG